MTYYLSTSLTLLHVNHSVRSLSCPDPWAAVKPQVWTMSPLPGLYWCFSECCRENKSGYVNETSLWRSCRLTHACIHLKTVHSRCSSWTFLVWFEKTVFLPTWQNNQGAFSSMSISIKFHIFSLNTVNIQLSWTFGCEYVWIQVISSNSKVKLFKDK